MQDIIVLGLVPGTHLQITFNSWLIIIASVLGVLLIWFAYRTHHLYTWFVREVVITSLYVTGLRR